MSTRISALNMPNSMSMLYLSIFANSMPVQQHPAKPNPAPTRFSVETELCHWVTDGIGAKLIAL